MNRTEWKEISRKARQARRDGRRPVFDFIANGIPYRVFATKGETIRTLADRLADRPTTWLVARELREAAEERENATDRALWRAHAAKRAARESLRMAREWRRPGWRDEIRAAARNA